MVYTVAAAIIGLISLLFLWMALKFLLRGTWILSFLRGCVGLAALCIVILMAFTAYDIYSYKTLEPASPIATLSFKSLGDQHFTATLLAHDGEEQKFDLHGDQWQLDARILKWPKVFGFLNVKPGFRLDRISGRYYSFEQERTATRSVYPLSESQKIDIWQLLQDYSPALHLARTTYGSATYLPMVDDSLFEISLTKSGLVSKPLNDNASNAVQQWQ